MTYTFSGTAIDVVGYKGTAGGYASVYLDGVLRTSSLSFYASSGHHKQTVWSASGLAAGPHTLQLVVKGTKPSASKGNWVYIDALKVDGTTMNRTPPASWVPSAGSRRQRHPARHMT